MELSDLVKKMKNPTNKRNARRKFLSVLNKDLKNNFAMKNITFGEFDSARNGYELQLVLHNDKSNSIDKLHNYAMESDFSTSKYVSGLSLFITRAFRHNKLWIKCTKSVLKNTKIDISHSRVHLDDPRRFDPRKQDGIKFWVQFRLLPKVTKR